MKKIVDVNGTPAEDPYEARLVKIVAEALGRGNGDCVASTEDVVAAIRAVSMESDCPTCAGSEWERCPLCKGAGRIRTFVTGLVR